MGEKVCFLQPQDAMSRHRTWFHTFVWGRLYLHLVLDSERNLIKGRDPQYLSLIKQASAYYLEQNVLSLPFRVSRYGVNPF